MRELEVNLSENAYTIEIGKNAVNCLPFMEDAVVVTDENVAALYPEQIKALAKHSVVVSAGEKSKSLAVLESLYQAFARCGLHRNSTVIAFGGGVVGDLAGFAAATFMRGVPYIQVPTTLLAQVDSSVGGKVAIDLEEGKNLVGAFYQPKKVVADTEILKTLPPREWRTGLGEVVKHGMLGNARILEILKKDSYMEDIDELVYENCKTKAAVVERDEREAGERMYLNLGHTFGHAIEKCSGYGTYTHGEAVAMGMVLAVKTGVALDLTAPETLPLLTGILDRHGIGYKLPNGMRIRDLVPLMLGDKKNTDETIRLVLLRRVGEPFLHPMKVGAIIACLEREGA